jgi:DNA-binding NarL/FixJ family response regulator
MNHTLVCTRRLLSPPDHVRAISLARETGVHRDFTSRERTLITEALAAVVPLIGGPLARLSEPSPADLPPRVRQVLRGLLEGKSDKQIAAKLGLSRYTVNQYTKVIYRHFGVEGRAELMAHWVLRRAGGTFRWDTGTAVPAAPLGNPSPPTRPEEQL